MKRELLKHELIDKVNELEQQNKELLEIKKQYDRVCERNTTLEYQNDELRSMT
jgi:regulator of replication initiation timing